MAQDFGNVLVVGSAGVGKSTLIEAVLGSNALKTTEGLRRRLAVYESLSAPFRIIDAGDAGSSLCARRAASHAVDRWSKEVVLDGNSDNDINVIWFCVEGKSRKLIRQQIRTLARATAVWRHVPIIVVITKSYAAFERNDNIALVEKACARRRRLRENLRAVIPVVATTYQLNETNFISPEGIPELIAATNDALPEGMQAVGADVTAFAIKRRRAVARSIVLASTAAGVAVGAVPIPISDALILTPIETGEVNAIAKLYGIQKDSASKQLLSIILEVGTVSTAAKAAISALKAVPGINLAASALNAIIAGSIVGAIGEGTMRVFERIYTGEKTIDDTEWVRRTMESKLSKEFIAQATKVLGKASGTVTDSSSKDQRKAIVSLLSTMLLESKTGESGTAAEA